MEVSLESLLNEMTDRDAVTRFPTIPYTQKQVSSYDRASIAPDRDGWWANDDGAGYERLELNEGRTEKVMCDLTGPGVIDRIWMTTREKHGNLRIYLDGASQAQIVIPAYDMRRFPANVPDGLSYTHTHYEESMDGVGGNSFFLPIPYAKSCKITFEEPDMSVKIPRYYHINYRTYPEGTPVKTFTLQDYAQNASLAQSVSQLLLSAASEDQGQRTEKKSRLKKGEELSISLPKGRNAVRELTIKLEVSPENYEDVMRTLIVNGSFDGIKCIEVPLADFSGGGMGAPEVKGWWIESDGKGLVKCRFPMPYRNKGEISLANIGNSEASLEVCAITSAYNWTDASLYFHASFRSEKGIRLSPDYYSNDNLDWNFMTISGGRGLYVGDLLSLYNYAPDWYGEGDEKIWVDDDTFPSHFGTGTEDYFNCSWAPVVPFLTPFGGAPRADEVSSHGYNAFLRTRILDVIPFTEKLRFDIEMLSWHPGTADYYATSFWYSDARAKANSTPISDL
ncbi:MAG: DUF2961 domain-containing protein [Bacteroidales bacterium]|nr:DUF2961 domain-containing protein [Bacteroidales bacterium]